MPKTLACNKTCLLLERVRRRKLRRELRQNRPQRQLRRHQAGVAILHRPGSVPAAALGPGATPIAQAEDGGQGVEVEEEVVVVGITLPDKPPASWAQQSRVAKGKTRKNTSRVAEAAGTFFQPPSNW